MCANCVTMRIALIAKFIKSIGIRKDFMEISWTNYPGIGLKEYS
jgi:hypothetical protein